MEQFQTRANNSVPNLYSGSGENTATDLYWGSGGAIWNNGGDTIIVKDTVGNTVIEREYP